MCPEFKAAPLSPAWSKERFCSAWQSGHTHYCISHRCLNQHLRIVQHLHVFVRQIIRQVGQVLFAQSAEEECAEDRIAGRDYPVERQFSEQPLFIADQPDPVLPRIGDFNVAAYDALQVFKGVVSLPFYLNYTFLMTIPVNDKLIIRRVDLSRTG